MPLLVAVTTCSIFMASIIRTGWPTNTVSPSPTSKLITVPCIGALMAATPAGRVSSTSATCVETAVAPAAPPWPYCSTANGSLLTCAPASTAAEPSELAEGSSFRSAGRLSSIKRVVGAPAANSGCSMSRLRNAWLVATPSILSESSALTAFRTAAENRGVRE